MEMERTESLFSRCDLLGSRFSCTSLPGMNTVDHTWMDSIPSFPKDRVAVQTNQGTNLVLHTISWLFGALQTAIASIFSKDRSQELQKRSFLLHSLYQSGILSLGDLTKYSKMIDQKEPLLEGLKETINHMHQTGAFERRATFHAMKLQMEGKVDNVLEFLLTYGCLNEIISESSGLELAISATEGQALAKRLKKSIDTAPMMPHTYFDESNCESVQSIYARLRLNTWILELGISPDEVSQLQKASRENNQNKYKQLISDVLLRKEIEEEGLASLYYKEMRESLHAPVSKNVFIHLAHILTTQETVASWKDEFTNLKDAVENASADSLNDVLPQLHKIQLSFGHFLEQEEKFYGSEAAFSHIFGSIKQDFATLRGLIANHLGVESVVHSIPEHNSTVTRPLSWPYDPVQAPIQSRMSSDLVIPRMSGKRTSLQPIATSSLELQNILKHMEPPLFFDSLSMDILEKHNPLTINRKTGRVEEAPMFNAGEMTEILNLIKDRLRHYHIVSPSSNAEHKHLVHVAEHMLRIVEKHDTTASAKSSLQKAATALDLYRASFTMKEHCNTPSDFARRITGEKNRKQVLEYASEFYITSGAKTALKKWVLEKTHTGRKEESEAYVSDGVKGAYGFITNPHAVEAITGMYLQRAISALDHTIEYTDSGMMTILVEGVRTPVDALLNRFARYQSRIVDKTSAKEWIYVHDRGLVPGSKEHWEGPLPVYKKVDPNPTQGFRLDVMSVEWGAETHAWIQLSDPEGNIYSVGKFWDKDVQAQVFSHTPAVIQTGDLHEYLPHEQFRTKTSIQVTSKEFEGILQSISDEQKSLHDQELTYDMLQDNCARFVHDVVAKTGHDIGYQVPALMAFIPSGRWLIPHYRDNMVARFIIDVFWKGVITQLFNFVSLAAGIRLTECISNQETIERIRSNYNPLDLERTMLWHPHLITQWQRETDTVLQSKQYAKTKTVFSSV